MELNLDTLRSTQPYVARNAAHEFVDADRSTAVARSLPFLNHSDSAVRTPIAEALSYQPFEPLCEEFATPLPIITAADVEPLLALMSHEDVAVRRCATQLLGDVRDTRAIPPLLIALNDACALVREFAVVSLTQRESAEVGEALIFVLKHDTSERVRRAALRAIRLSKPAGGFDAVAASMANDTDSTNRSHAVSILKDLDPARATPILANALRLEPDWIERCHIIKQFPVIAEKVSWDESVEELLREISEKDPNEFVRKDAKHVLFVLEKRRLKVPGW